MEEVIILKSEVGDDTPAMADEPTPAGIGHMAILLNRGSAPISPRCYAVRPRRRRACSASSCRD